MKDCPLPVVMVSSITRKGADATIKAMGLGAIDFICKPNGSLSKLDSVADEILAKCRAAAQVKIRKRLNGSLAVFPPPVKKPLSTVKVEIHGNENDNDLDSRKYQTDNKGSRTFFRRTIHRPGLQYRRTKCAAGICPAAAGESALSGAYGPAYAAGIHGEPCTAAG